MKILTTVKKVVDVELTIHVEDGAIVEKGLQYVINAWDESAVEAAVQLKENNGAETTLVSIGGEDNIDIRIVYVVLGHVFLGVIVDGVPPNLSLSESDIQFELDRRKPGQSKATSQRQESDLIEIVSV